MKGKTAKDWTIQLPVAKAECPYLLAALNIALRQSEGELDSQFRLWSLKSNLTLLAAEANRAKLGGPS